MNRDSMVLEWAVLIGQQYPFSALRSIGSIERALCDFFLVIIFPQFLMLNFNSFAFCTGNFLKFQIQLFVISIKTFFFFASVQLPKERLAYTSGSTHTQGFWP